VARAGRSGRGLGGKIPVRTGAGAIALPEFAAHQGSCSPHALIVRPDPLVTGCRHGAVAAVTCTAEGRCPARGLAAEQAAFCSDHTRPSHREGNRPEPAQGSLLVGGVSAAGRVQRRRDTACTRPVPSGCRRRAHRRRGPFTASAAGARGSPGVVCQADVRRDGTRVVAFRLDSLNSPSLAWRLAMPWTGRSRSGVWAGIGMNPARCAPEWHRIRTDPSRRERRSPGGDILD